MTPDLASGRVVFVKELAAAVRASEKTVIRRMHLWDRDPAHPLAIPYLRHLGRPYRTTREIAARLGCVESAA